MVVNMKKLINETIQMNYVSLEEVLDKIKEYNLEPKDVSLSAEDMGEYVGLTINFEYKRLETDEEYSKRNKHEQQSLQRQEVKERSEYARLSKKYGNT